MSDCMCPSNCGTNAVTQPVPPAVTVVLSTEDTTMMGVMFDKLVNAFVMPAVNATVAVEVAEPDNYVVGMWVYIVGIGYLEVTAVGATTITLKNIGNTSNEAPGTTVIALTTMIPGFPKANSDDNIHPVANTAEVFITTADNGTVTFEVTDNSWIVAGMTLWIKGAGKLLVTAVNVDGTHITVLNNKTLNTANTGAGVSIAAGTAVFPCDVSPYREQFTVAALTATFVTVADGLHVDIVIEDNRWAKVDMTLFVRGAGKLKVISVNADGVTIHVLNNKTLNTANTGSGTTIAIGVPVFPCDDKAY